MPGAKAFRNISGNYIEIEDKIRKAFELLDVKNRLWPGGPLPPDYEYQFVEGKFMKDDEYDLFLSDPSDFIVRYYLPRMHGALMPLSKLPSLGIKVLLIIVY